MSEFEYIPSLEHRLHALFSAPDYRPLRRHELASRLALPDSERRALRGLLRRLEKEGRAVCTRGNRWGPNGPTGPERSGRLQMHPSGFGFVILEPPEKPDVFIPPDRLGTALHGDRVAVEMFRQASRDRGPDAAPRAEGRVLQVLDRGRSQVAGLLMRTPYYWYVIPDDKRMVHDVRITEFGPDFPDPPPERHKVLVTLQPWAHPERPLCGTATEDLGAEGAPGVDITALLRAQGYSEDFSEEVMQEAAAESRTPSPEDLQGRTDIQDRCCVTIDPDTARDFDDAVSLQARPDGGWILGVHIADVAHYVRPGSAVDREARRRGTSVYLVDRVITMLPGNLTREVCSLNPNEPRLAHTVEIVFAPDGRAESQKSFRSVIHSSARLSYDQVQGFLDGQGELEAAPPVPDLLRRLHAFTRVLRQRRMDAGSIDFALPEVKCLMNEEGRVRAIVRREAAEAYQLIEECMLAANQAVATLLFEGQVPSLYRVHPEPEESGWAQMAADLQAAGVAASPSTREDLHRIVASVQGAPNAYAAYLAILRNLQRANYAAGRDDHFGLAFSLYTHFTSPIRRYPDLVVHRVLCAQEEGLPPPYSPDELAAVAAHCSLMEEEAETAERDSVDMKRVEYYQDRLQAGAVGPYPGVLVGITPKGLLVELRESLQKGLASFADLHDDHYEADLPRGRAVGRHGGRRFTLGQVLEVDLVRVDTARRRVDFRLHGESGPARRGKGRGRSPVPHPPRRRKHTRRRR